MTSAAATGGAATTSATGEAFFDPAGWPLETRVRGAGLIFFSLAAAAAGGSTGFALRAVLGRAGVRFGVSAGFVLSGTGDSALGGSTGGAGAASTTGAGCSADLREVARLAGPPGGNGDGSALGGVWLVVDLDDGRFFCDIYLQRVKSNRWKPPV